MEVEHTSREVVDKDLEEAEEADDGRDLESPGPGNVPQPCQMVVPEDKQMEEDKGKAVDCKELAVATGDTTMEAAAETKSSVVLMKDAVRKKKEDLCQR